MPLRSEERFKAVGDVKVYDNFTQLPLPLLDPRYEREGAPLFRE